MNVHSTEFDDLDEDMIDLDDEEFYLGTDDETPDFEKILADRDAGKSVSLPNCASANEVLAYLEGLKDDQFVDIRTIYHDGDGSDARYRISVFDFRKQLLEPKTESDAVMVNVHFNPGMISFEYHDYYSMKIVTPLMLQQEEDRRVVTSKLKQLEEMGVSNDVLRLVTSEASDLKWRLPLADIRSQIETVIKLIGSEHIASN